METIATYADDQSLQLAEQALRKIAIPYITRPVQGEIPTIEVLVSEEHYDRACDVIEALEDILVKIMQKDRKPQFCRYCGSGDLRPIEDFNSEDSITGIASLFECRECGRPNVC